MYVTEKIKRSIEYNTNEQGRLNLVKFVISNRDNNLAIIKPYFDESDTFTKIFGLGLYYLEYDFIYVELDLLDLLFTRGIYGFILYITFLGAIIIKLFMQVIKNIKQCHHLVVLLMFLTLGYIGVASIFVGHVLFNLMPLTIAIMVILYYMFIISEKIKCKE